MIANEQTYISYKDQLVFIGVLKEKFEIDFHNIGMNLLLDLFAPFQSQAPDPKLGVLKIQGKISQFCVVNINFPTIWAPALSKRMIEI